MVQNGEKKGVPESFSEEVEEESRARDDEEWDACPVLGSNKLLNHPNCCITSL